MNHFEVEALRVMKKFGWKSRTFALEYVMGTKYYGFSHEHAIREAKRSPLLKPSDIPRGV